MMNIERNRIHAGRCAIGDKFGAWTIVGGPGTYKNHTTTWLCECSCGASKRDIVETALVFGKTKMCRICSNRLKAHSKWDRVDDIIESKIMPIPFSGCHIWMGAFRGKKGRPDTDYGMVRVRNA